MDSLPAFFDMGGYGAFVWPSFAITVAVLAGLLVASDEIGVGVDWEQPIPNGIRGNSVRLGFELTDAEIFSYWWQ